MPKMGIYTALIISFLFVGCDREPLIESGSNYPPEKVFQHIIKSPLPESVSLLQGDAETWQGYRAFLRFKASPQYINSLVSSGFTSVEWQRVSYNFNLLPNLENRFKPAWNPEFLTNKKCYLNEDVENDWTNSGFHYLVIDHDNGIVYFSGSGT